MDFTIVYYIGLLQYLFVIHDFYILSYKSSLKINPKIGFSGKVLMISFIDKMYWAHIVSIFVLIIVFALYYRL